MSTSRQAYKRAHQAKRRASLGGKQIQVELTAEEFALFERLAAQQRGPLSGVAKRMLMLGAKFLANAGTARGRKYKTPAEPLDNGWLCKT